MYATAIRIQDDLPLMTGFGNNAQLTHSFVMSLFPKGETDCPRQEFATLYQHRGEELLVQSAVQPDLEKIPSHCLLSCIDNDIAWVRNGILVAFDLDACPVYYEKASRETRGIRKPLSFDGYPAWIRRQMAESGLEILTLQISEPFTRVGYHGRAPLWHMGSRFSGTGKILHSERLVHALQHGLGIGKAYGWGLIRLSEIKEES